MTKEEMAKAYADGYYKEYQQIAYDAFLCGYGAKCDSAIQVDLEEAADDYEKGYYDDNSAAKRASYHGFIAGAEWQKAKMLEDAVLPPRSLLRPCLLSKRKSFRCPASSWCRRTK